MPWNDATSNPGQGEADRYAQWFYDRLDPLTHLEAYERPVAVSFHCGSEDRHVPSDGAERFRAALVERDPSAADRVRVTTYPGLSRLDGALDGATARRLRGNPTDGDGHRRPRLSGARRAHPRRARSIVPSPLRIGVPLLTENIGDFQIIDDLVDVRRPSDR